MVNYNLENLDNSVDFCTKKHSYRMNECQFPLTSYRYMEYANGDHY